MEGHLGKVTEDSKDTTYLYDTDGNQLIQNDPTNTTLYLPGEDLMRNKATGTVNATRYYAWAGQTIGCITTGGALTWLLNDPQGTQQVSVDNGNQNITQRRQTPYGAPRGTKPTWVNTRGFVGGVNDPTGLAPFTNPAASGNVSTSASPAPELAPACSPAASSCSCPPAAWSSSRSDETGARAVTGRWVGSRSGSGVDGAGVFGREVAQADRGGVVLQSLVLVVEVGADEAAHGLWLW